MDWPTWTEVVPLLTVIAALLGAAWAWARLSDRTVSRAVEKAGKESTAAARQATDDLYERLKSNDFKHVEDAMNAIGDRIDRMDVRTEARLKRMETRILEAVRGRPDALAQPTSPGPEITGGLGFDENEDPES